MNVEGKEQGCGIAQILIQLCLNEAKIHEVTYSGNQALELLQAYYAPNEYAVEVERAKAFCKKLVAVENLVKPLYLAFLYLDGAILSGFSRTFIMLSNDEVYPSSGFTPGGPTSDLYESYNGDGGMYEKGEVINVHDTNWFFCFPSYKSPYNIR